MEKPPYKKLASANRYSKKIGLIPPSILAIRRCRSPEGDPRPAGPAFGHIMDHDLEDAIEHPAGDNVAQGFVQHGNVPPQAAEYLHVLEGVLYLHLHHVMDEALITGALRTGEKQLHRLSVLAHPVWIGAGFHPRVLQLLLFGQLGKGI